jgi:general secretion pathway protein G
MRCWEFRSRGIGFAVVLALVLLVAVVRPELIRHQQSRYQQVREQILELQNRLSEFYLDNGFYPETNPGLRALKGFVSSEIDPGIVRPRPEVPPEPRDPWGHPFYYKSDGQTYVLGSFGSRPERVDPEIKVDSAGRHP